MALAAGKHVYTEWPFAINSTETNELANLAAAAGVKHTVGLQGRSAAMVNYVRDLVADGFVGTVHSASVRIGRSLVFGAVTPDNKWASDRSFGSNRFTIGAGHAFDDVRYMLGEFMDVVGIVSAQVKTASVVGTDEVIEVTAPDNVLVNAHLENGILLSFAMLSSMSSGIRFEVHGEDGELVVTGPSSLHLSPVGLSLTGAKGTEAAVPMPVPESYRPAPASVPDGSAVNVAGLYTKLAVAIRDDTQTDPNFETARSLYVILDAIDKASATGQRQTIIG
jgi:predicted dehydrogenase